MTRIILLALVCTVAPVTKAALPAHGFSSSVTQAPSGSSAPPPPQAKRALSSENEETLELVRWAFQEDRGNALDVLQEAIEAGTGRRDDPSSLSLLIELEALAKGAGDLGAEKLVLLARVESQRERLGPLHPDVLATQLELARVHHELGDERGANELCEAVHAARLRSLAPDHPDLLEAKLVLAVTRVGLGDLDGARALEEEVVAIRVRVLPPDDPDLLHAQSNLAVTRKELGDLEGALELKQQVLVSQVRTLGEEHAEVLRSKLSIAVVKGALGDESGALALEEEVLAVQTRLLPEGHPDLLFTKMNLGISRYRLGNLPGAKRLFQEVVAARQGQRPPDDAELLESKIYLAAAEAELGQLHEAHVLEQEVLATLLGRFPRDHEEVLKAMLNLAVTRKQLGDLRGAQTLEEEVLVRRAATLPADHPALLLARQNLALTRKGLGDTAGARELEEEVLARRSLALPENHPDLLAAKLNLAGTRWNLGDIPGAHDLFAAVAAAWSRTLPAEHPDVLLAKSNLAVVKLELGDLTEAERLSEEVLAAFSSSLQANDARVLGAKFNLAAVRSRRGDLAGAGALLREVLELRERLLPADHPDLLAARQNLAELTHGLGDVDGTRKLVSELLAGVRARSRTLRAEAPRPAREGAQIELRRLYAARILCEAMAPGERLDAELFAAVESLRFVTLGCMEAARAVAKLPGLAEQLQAISHLRSQLNDIAAVGPATGTTTEDWRKEVLRLAQDRDRAERELRSQLAHAGAFVEEIDAALVGARLGPDAAAVSFLRCPDRSANGPGLGRTARSSDLLVAFVVRPGGAVRLVDLGAAGEMETLVQDWRQAVGRPLFGRGVSAGATAGVGEAPGGMGSELRTRLLDPVLAAAGQVHTLHVELDDFVHLVPLDALPLGDGLVGDRLAIRNEVTLARLVRGSSGSTTGDLTVAGGIDYDAEPASQSPPLDASIPPVEEGALRAGSDERVFAFLPATEAELETIAVLCRASGHTAKVLRGADATKGSLYAAAPGTRFLHLATHGWFANPSFPSQLAELSSRSLEYGLLRAEETVAGFAPETLCGLALSGANRGRDAVGRVPGILTAEELATFDLRNCELAVLSACETNVGIRRSGQGIQSLQTALHAAGARTAIASLWKVEDEATRRLFELFYAKLWTEKLGKADALWQAKMILRAEGRPLRDWAGWVLSGDPD